MCLESKRVKTAFSQFYSKKGFTMILIERHSQRSMIINAILVEGNFDGPTIIKRSISRIVINWLQRWLRSLEIKNRITVQSSLKGINKLIVAAYYNNHSYRLFINSSILFFWEIVLKVYYYSWIINKTIKFKLSIKSL